VAAALALEHRVPRLHLVDGHVSLSGVGDRRVRSPGERTGVSGHVLL
jgi:hypothetical protein